jgi:hypothetical protein
VGETLIVVVVEEEKKKKRKRIGGMDSSYTRFEVVFACQKRKGR